MSTTPSSDELYFHIFAPYQTGATLEQHYKAVRDAHITRLQRIHAETGMLKCGGPYMSLESLAPNAEKKPIGSAITVRAQSYEAVKELVENDPYYTNDVWDKEKLVIVPFVFFTSN